MTADPPVSGKAPSARRHHARIRLAITVIGVTILLPIGFFWTDSYFTGRKWYRSIWRETESGVAERASWRFSNYGSFGFAWRRQAGVLGSDPPEHAREVSQFAASRTALGHVHPKGLLRWHWIHHQSTPPRMSGSIRHDYGHLFIPYWMPFLLCLLLIFSANSGSSDREEHPE